MDNMDNINLKPQNKVNDNGLINDNEVVRLTCYATETKHYHDLVIIKNKDDHGIFELTV